MDGCEPADWCVGLSAIKAAMGPSAERVTGLLHPSQAEALLEFREQGFDLASDVVRWSNRGTLAPALTFSIATIVF